MLVQIHTDQGTQKRKKSKAKAEGCQCPQYSLNGLLKKKKKNLKKQFKWSLGSPYKQRPEGTAAPY